MVDQILAMDFNFLSNHTENEYNENDDDYVIFNIMGKKEQLD